MASQLTARELTSASMSPVNNYTIGVEDDKRFSEINEYK
jgi:hypothetical protein